MTAEEWDSQVSLQGVCPTSWLRHSHRKLFLFLAAYLPRLLSGPGCAICRSGLRLFEAEAERKTSIDDWRAVTRADHPEPLPGLDCPTRRVFKHTTQYLRDIFCPAVYWDTLLIAHREARAGVGGPRRAGLEDDEAGSHRAESAAVWQAGMQYLKELLNNPIRPLAVEPTWLTPTVLSLAEAVYADRTLDRLPILADALQDAGCENPDLLTHLRGEGPHVRGCWAVDLLLGKE
ncbi:MAG: hypothetical protein JWO38_1126 [Gemmataceae bacterium]|nr:hypothetical protein [Gemmataceae bacterium]